MQMWTRFHPNLCSSLKDVEVYLLSQIGSQQPNLMKLGAIQTEYEWFLVGGFNESFHVALNEHVWLEITLCL